MRLRPLSVDLILPNASALDLAGLLPPGRGFAFLRRDTRDRTPLTTCVGLDCEDVGAASGETDPFDRLDQLLSEVELESGETSPAFGGGYFLYLSHEAVSGARGHGPGPAWRLLLTREFLNLDHHTGRAALTRLANAAEDEVVARAALHDRAAALEALAAAGPPRRQSLPEGFSGTWCADASAADHAAGVEAIQAAIRHGGMRQAILSVGLSKSTRAEPLDVLGELLHGNPSPHAYLFRDGDFALVGSSPLMHLLKRGSEVVIETDAGTRPVVADEVENRRLAAELMACTKDLEEQRIIVEATAADLRRVAADGRVAVPLPLELRRFSHVMHIYTVLSAVMGDGVSIGDLLRACSPAAAVAGDPKGAAASLAMSLERGPRGPYGGVIGLVGFDGSVDTAVILRSAWFKGGRAMTRSGGGIVADSVPAAEHAECLDKARAVMAAVAAAEGVANGTTAYNLNFVAGRS